MYKDKEEQREYQKGWERTHRSQRLEYTKEWRQRCRIMVLQFYSNGYMECKKCGYDESLDALCIDHIKGGGLKHRKMTGHVLSEWLVLNNFPSGFQVLCANCNMIKALNEDKI